MNIQSTIQLIPKICEYDDNLNPVIYSQILATKQCEIQLLGKAIEQSISNLDDLHEYLPKTLTKMVIHVPFNMMNFDEVGKNTRLKSNLTQLLNYCISKSWENHREYGVVIHISSDWNTCENLELLDTIQHFISIINGTKVKLLIENEIISLNINDSEEHSFNTLFKHINHPNIAACFDICHWQASEYALNKNLSLSDETLNKIQHIHFSATYKCDGYRNKKETHGKCHIDKQGIIGDISYMENLGINLNQVSLVAEINEENYEDRPDLVTEIQLFNEIYNKPGEIAGCGLA